MLRRLLLVVAMATALAAVAPAAPAAAGPIPTGGSDVCGSRQAPDPRPPRSGLSALVAERPAEVPSGDPWREGAAPAELYATYGTAGLWWPTYDPGCNPASEWGMSASTGIGQLGQSIGNFFLDVTSAVRSWAWRTDWLRPVDETMTAFSRSLGPYAGPMVGLALIAAGGWMALRARRAALSETAKLGGWAVGIMVLGVFALSAPTALAGLVDTYGVGTAQLLEHTLSGEDVRVPDGARGDSPELVRTHDPLVGLTTREVAYQSWLVGMFGSAESATAAKYGPRFYRAMALSWDEAALPDDELEEVKERKRQDFTAAAEELREEDPSAFQVMQGKTAFSDRVATGWLSGALLNAVTTLFALVAGVCVLLARLVARFGAMALPIVVPFGLVMPYRQPVTAVAKLVGGAVATAIMYTMASGLMVRLTAAMLSSSMPLLLVVAVVLALTIVLLAKLRVGRVLRSVVGLRIAHKLATDDDQEAAAPEPDEPVPANTTRRSESRPAPVPPPLWAGSPVESRPLGAGASAPAGLPPATASRPADDDQAPPRVIDVEPVGPSGSPSGAGEPYGMPPAPVPRALPAAPAEAASEGAAARLDEHEGDPAPGFIGAPAGPAATTTAEAGPGPEVVGEHRELASWVTEPPPPGGYFRPAPGRAGGLSDTPEEPRSADTTVADDDSAPAEDDFRPAPDRARPQPVDTQHHAMPVRRHEEQS